MNKILTIDQAVILSAQSKQKGKTIVLAGGCFDVFHRGHLVFLEAAKKQGNLLFLLLESDESIKKKKGKGRPVNSQENRSIVLSAISSVNYVIPLRGMTNNKEYDKLIVQIKPDIIAMTKGDPGEDRRRKQCETVGAKLKLVTDRVEDNSTSDLIKNIWKD